MTTKPEDIAAVAQRWQARLRPAPHASAQPKGDAGAVAMLRRAHSPMDVLLVPAFHTLRAEVPDADVERLSLVAALLGHVREHRGDESVARQLAGDGRTPPMHPRRFHRLLQERGGWSAEHRQLQRAVKLLGGRVNVRDLSESAYAWDERRRRRWALDYYDLVPESKEQ